MSVFQRPLEQVRRFMERHRLRGACRELQAGDPTPWLDGPQVVMRQDAALELGGPSRASCFALLWDDETPGAMVHGRITRIGPDLPELAGGAPLALVITAGGPPVADEHLHQHLSRLRDATYGVHLRGAMARILPSQQSVWFRLGADALGQGLDARVLGSALQAAVKAQPGVEAVEVLMVTAGAQQVRQLWEAASLAASISDALSSMEQGLEMECEGCQHQAVCDLVDELRHLHGAVRTADPRHVDPSR